MKIIKDEINKNILTMLLMLEKVWKVYLLKIKDYL